MFHLIQLGPCMFITCLIFGIFSYGNPTNAQATDRCHIINSEIYKRAIVFPGKNIIEIGSIARKIGETSVKDPTSFMQENSQLSCKFVVSADWNSNGDYIINSYSKILRMAVLFTQVCKQYRINDARLAKFTQYFKVTEISDGFRTGMDGVSVTKAISEKYGVVTEGLLRLRKLPIGQCDQEFSERLRYVSYIEKS